MSPSKIIIQANTTDKIVSRNNFSVLITDHWIVDSVDMNNKQLVRQQNDVTIFSSEIQVMKHVFIELTTIRCVSSFNYFLYRIPEA